jgi:hypothetical protein
MNVRSGGPLLLGIAALVLAACGAPLLSNGAAYTYSAPYFGTVVVSSSALTSSNDREFFVPTLGTTYADSSACETVDGASPTQPGIAFRITDKNDVTAAITITENIFGTSGYNDFNVHVWDTSKTPAYILVGQVTIHALPSSSQPEPLNLCAEITGNVLQFVVWTSGTQPAWGDPTWGGSVTLPSNAPTSGDTGFFAGHIPVGTSATYSNLTVDGEVNNPVSCCLSAQLGSSSTAG